MGSGVVHAHRNILAAISPYFQAMFYGSYKEKEEDEINLSASFNSVSALEDIIDFMYTGQAELNEKNFEAMIGGASLFLLLNELQLVDDTWPEFLLDNLDPRNCLFIWAMAEKFYWPQLEKLCRTLTRARFHDLFMNLDETLEISGSFLTVMLRDDDIRSNLSPDNFCDFLSRWIEHDHERLDKCTVLLDP